MTAALRSQDDTAAWRIEVAAVNLGRLRWLWGIVLVMMVLFGASIPFVPPLRTTEFIARTVVDIGISLAMMAGGIWVSRRPADSAWRMRYGWCSVGAILLGLTTWFFEALPVFGLNSDYALGVIIVGAVVLLPPRAVAGVLIANHAVFCTLLWSSPHSRVLIVNVLVDNTAAVVLAWFVAWFLYRAREVEFHRARALAASNAELREVMAIAAHDMRSPLLGLRDLLGLARREPQVGGVLERMLRQAESSCATMVQLVSRLVEAHAAEEAEGELQLVPQDLRDASAAAVERLRPTAERKRQRIALALPAAPAAACVDATSLAQVLENLLGNALKFSAPGTRVELALAAAEGGAWWIDVSDEGPGIPVEERTQMFRKFYRGSPRPTGGESSTGLGLFIVKTLTEAMRGRVSYLPREPQGAIFRIELPRG